VPRARDALRSRSISSSDHSYTSRDAASGRSDPLSSESGFEEARPRRAA
jgi:hypothetical protein